MFPVNRKPGGPGGPNAGCPSDHQAREKLALYVYEYLHHIGAKEAAQTFLKEIRWDKNITLGEPPGFLHSWWCVFWDLYCAAPERRETCEHSQEAKAFHDYVGIQGFVNSGFPPQVNGIHGPNATPSPIGMPSSGPDGIPPGAGHPGIPGPSGPPPFFTGPGGVPIRPSPPQQVPASSQASPHHSGPSGMMPCISQPAMAPGGPGPRYMGPRGGPGPGQRMPVGSEGGMMGFPGHPGMFPPDQMRPGGMMTLQRLPPSGHPRMQQINPNNFGAMRPPGGVPVSAGLRHPVSWAPSTSSAPIMSNGPGPGPGTPGIMPSPQNMPPSDMNTGDRFGVMPGSVGPMGQSFGPMTSEASMVGGPGGDQMMMNGDGLDIKNSPSSSQGLNGQGTPGPNGQAPPGGTGGPGGPGSVPPSSGAPGSADSMEFSNSNPFNQGQDLEQQASEIAKIKQSMMEETKHFESKDGVTTGNRPDGDYDF